MRPKEELGLDQIRAIFSRRLFQNCVTVSLTGGEPTMRRDLGEIPKILAETLPTLRQVNLTSNGYTPSALSAHLESCLPVLQSHRVGMSVNISIDGVGEVHDRVRGREGAFENLSTSVSVVLGLQQRYRVNLALACTITRGNLAGVRDVLEYAKRLGVYVIFRNGFTIRRIGSESTFGEFGVTPAQIPDVIDFYANAALRYDPTYQRREYYRMLLRMLKGGERDVPCLYRKAGLFIDHRGEMFVCTVFSDRIGSAIGEHAESQFLDSAEHRSELACRDCRKCSHDVTLYTSLVQQGMEKLRAHVTGVKR
jgi:MoaA/NifB/PqqE/SkfB family radical SAM enzyme